MYSGLISATFRSITVIGLFLVTSVPATANAPTGRYHISSGQVVDTGTGLIWQQISSDIAMTWAEAQAYCGGEGWRLPSMKELQTLVDETRLLPALDTSVFPVVFAESGYGYWSSSAVAGLVSYVWIVHFESGQSDYDDQTRTYRVRCCRSAVKNFLAEFEEEGKANGER